MGENGQPMLPTAQYAIAQPLMPLQEEEDKTGSVMYVEMNNWNSYWRRSIHRGSEPERQKDMRDLSKGTGLGIVAHDAGHGLYAPNDGRLQRQEDYLSMLRLAV